MSIIANPVPSLSMLVPEFPRIYRMTVHEYERLASQLDDPRVELVDGYLVKKMPKKPPHIWSVGSILDATGRLLPSEWSLRKEDPVRIPEFDEPEPDIAVVRGSRDDYRNRLPSTEDVALLVEVADTTLQFDRNQKGAAYARGGIPIYWIVNLVDRQLEAYSQPTADGYQSLEVFRAGEEAPVVIAGVEVGRIKVSDILP